MIYISERSPTIAFFHFVKRLFMEIGMRKLKLLTFHDDFGLWSDPGHMRGASAMRVHTRHGSLVRRDVW